MPFSKPSLYERQDAGVSQPYTWSMEPTQELCQSNVTRQVQCELSLTLFLPGSY